MSDQILLEETEALIPMASMVREPGHDGREGYVFGYTFGYVYEFNPSGGSDDSAWPMVEVNFPKAWQMVAVSVRSLEIFIDLAWVNGETLHQQIIDTCEAKGWKRWGG